MIISLGFQAVLNLYTSIIIIYVDIDRQQHEEDGLTEERTYSFITRKVWVSFLVESVLKLITMLTASLAYIYQIYEWFSILYLIRYESKSSIKTIIYRNHEEVKEGVSVFNL